MSDQEPKNPVARTERADRRLSGFEGDLHTEPMRIQFGPSHPATHGTVRIMLDLDGERVIDADVQVGYLHRGGTSISKSFSTARQ